MYRVYRDESGHTMGDKIPKVSCSQAEPQAFWSYYTIQSCTQVLDTFPSSISTTYPDAS